MTSSKKRNGNGGGSKPNAAQNAEGVGAEDTPIGAEFDAAIEQLNEQYARAADHLAEIHREGTRGILATLGKEPEPEPEQPETDEVTV